MKYVIKIQLQLKTSLELVLDRRPICSIYRNGSECKDYKKNDWILCLLVLDDSPQNFSSVESSKRCVLFTLIYVHCEILPAVQINCEDAFWSWSGKEKSVRLIYSSCSNVYAIQRCSKCNHDRWNNTALNGFLMI